MSIDQSEKNKCLTIIKQAHNFDKIKVKESIDTAIENGWMSEFQVKQHLKRSSEIEAVNKAKREELDVVSAQQNSKLEAKGQAIEDKQKLKNKIVIILNLIAIVVAVLTGIWFLIGVPLFTSVTYINRKNRYFKRNYYD